jgi:uncharacterized peroxidase-related enzyme
LTLRGEAVNSGRTLQAIRDNELRAEALGVPTFALQIVSSTVASVVAVVVGARASTRECGPGGVAMAWIHVTNEERAEGLLKQAYERIRRVLGRIIPFYRAYSVSPRLLHAHLDFYAAAGTPGALSKVRKELIATAVSADNGCHHSTQLHGGFLGKLTTDQGLVRALMTDPATAPLHGADRALITYALKLTPTPREVRESDVAALRAAGFSDTEIFEAASVTAYFNYTNRVAEGLGIEPEG